MLSRQIVRYTGTALTTDAGAKTATAAHPACHCDGTQPESGLTIALWRDSCANMEDSSPSSTRPKDASQRAIVNGWLSAVSQ